MHHHLKSCTLTWILYKWILGMFASCSNAPQFTENAILTLSRIKTRWFTAEVVARQANIFAVSSYHAV
jgi:hypothetical protein